MVPFFTSKTDISYIPETERKNLLGGKGAGLFELRDFGARVPDFIVIPTSVAVDFEKDAKGVAQRVWDTVPQIIEQFRAPDGSLPYMSARSGARVSMPGMMDTILNVGADMEETKTFAAKLPERTVADSHRRFLQMFGTTVYGLPAKEFEAVMDAARKEAKVDTDADLEVAQLNKIVGDFEAIYGKTGRPVPKTLREQLFYCIMAVLKSWNSERAKEYRKINDIPNEWGTAVVVQRMAFGNMNDNSGSGVLFTYCPKTGENAILGEFLPNAQGEDVVAGIRTPLKLIEMTGDWAPILSELSQTASNLEYAYRDMLDIEFTVENGVLYFLQVRVGKRASLAAVRIALDLAERGFISNKQIGSRFTAQDIIMMATPTVDASFDSKAQVKGIPACAGAVTGVIARTSDEAVKLAAAGKKCILVTKETSPDDIAGMNAAIGVLTATGGETSHAAVVARAMNRPCVVGATTLFKNLSSSSKEITICGTTGRVWIDVNVKINEPDAASVKKMFSKFVPPAAVELWSPSNKGGRLLHFSQFINKVPEYTGKQNEAVTILDDIGHFAGDEALCLLSPEQMRVRAEKNVIAFIEKYGKIIHHVRFWTTMAYPHLGKAAGTKVTWRVPSSNKIEDDFSEMNAVSERYIQQAKFVPSSNMLKASTFELDLFGKVLAQ